MINRHLLQLTEISEKTYVGMKKEMGLSPRESPRTNQHGFAVISRPLVYYGFEEIVKDFIDTPGARRASVKIKNGDWFRLIPDEMTDFNLDLMCKLATEAGFLYVCFYNGINNEIGFELFPDEKRIISANIAIPGFERGLYDWVGSGNEFYIIYGMYKPEDIRAYADRRKGKRPQKKWKTSGDENERRVLKLLDRIRRERRINAQRDNFPPC